MQKVEPPYAFPPRTDGDPDRVALVLPGGGYGPARPALHFTRTMLRRHGWTVQELWWQPPWADLTGSTSGERAAWVREQVEAALAAETASRLLLAGKSLGSYAVAVAAERDLPAVWLTPLLVDPLVAEPVVRCTAPALLVGGTADPAWVPEVARRSRQQVLELAGVDHGLEDDAAPARNAVVLGELTTALDGFLTGLR